MGRNSFSYLQHFGRIWRKIILIWYFTYCWLLSENFFKSISCFIFVMGIGDNVGYLLPREPMSQFFHGVTCCALLLCHLENIQDQWLFIEEEVHTVIVLILSHLINLFSEGFHLLAVELLSKLVELVLTKFEQLLEDVTAFSNLAGTFSTFTLY